MQAYLYTILIPLLPLIGFLLLGLGGRKYFKRSSGWIATTILLATTILSLYTAYKYFFVDGKVPGESGVYGVYKEIIPFRFTWLSFSEGISIDMGFILDPISVLMIVIVSFVSLMVHLFSIGYLKGEERISTYFSFLSLFTFSMLGLVLSSNIFQIYIFWELVGISSFLLIGFYYQKPAAVAAAKKAFIVTRFADLGFLIGILILGFYSGSLDFQTIIQRLTSVNTPEFIAITSAGFLGLSALTWALALIFVGGAGKSAMFPLHIWLPDAMEGPTPVSALIHAATMVVAGVYLVARLFPVFSIDPVAMNIVTWVGLSSAVIAAIIACTQTDIKRVLAYSTMSQIGFMMFSLGIVSYGGHGEGTIGFSASMFHLFTHAFFKSLLFLCAGVVIHFVHSNEIKDMGGLRKRMPLTHIAFLIGCLAIAGIPPFAGFFSKEEILLAAHWSNKFVYYTALLTAALTAFYMFRLYFSIFWKKESDIQSHRSEGPLTMKLPLVILSVAAIVAGFVPFGNFVTLYERAQHPVTDLLFFLTPVTLAIIAIILAAVLYKKENTRPQRLATSMGGFYKAASRKFYIDEIYLFITKRVIFNLIGRPAAWIDRNIIDGMINGMARVTATTSSMIRGLQSGRFQQYALWFFGGVVGLAIVIIYLWK